MRKKMTPLVALKRYWQLYLFLLIPLAYIITFKYAPMVGIQLAFKNFEYDKGLFGSPWIGLRHFQRFFGSYIFARVLVNTLRIAILSMIFSMPFPILFALLLNSINAKRYKKIVQTITYMPYFISLVVTCSIIKIYCQENGLFSQIIEIFGGTRRNLLIDSGAYRPIYVLSGIWQNIGWNSIIYLAALSGIDQEQYEAARIDGANRFQQMLHITIPGILPTIMILFVLRMGSILNVGYEKVLLLYTENTYNVADVFSTYTYRVGLEQKQYSLSTAVSLFNTVVNIMFLVFTNWLSRKTTESGLF